MTSQNTTIFKYSSKPMWIKLTKEGIDAYIDFYLQMYGWEPFFSYDARQWAKMSLSKLDMIFDYNRDEYVKDVCYSDPRELGEEALARNKEKYRKRRFDGMKTK